MPMAVTDEQVAALHAQLADDANEHRRLLTQLDLKTGGRAYVALIDAAFFEAVERRFGNRSTTADIIEYVADVRARSQRLADAVDVRTAEQVIRMVFSDSPMEPLDGKTALTAKQVLLAALIADEHLDDSGLDKVLADARQLADRMAG
jgi:hypothetical protein